MTIDAVCTALDRASRMALQAFVVEEGSRLRRRGLMRAMTRQTGKLACALQKAATLAQVNGLMAHVPSEIPIEGDVSAGSHAMTAAAKVIQLRSGELSGIHKPVAPRIGRVLRSRSVTTFATNTILGEMDLSFFIERDRPGGVAFETAFDPELRVGDFVQHTRRFLYIFWVQVTLSGRWTVGFRRCVPTGEVLDVPFLIDARYERDRLPGRAKCPFERKIHQVGTIVDVNAQAVLNAENLVAVSGRTRNLVLGETRTRRYRRQRSRMRACPLRNELGRVA